MSDVQWTIRRSTVAELLEGHCVFYCADFSCGIHTFKAYPDPDEPAFCPACDVRAYEVVA
tara:strand:+ start:518 stop:697 length:180 start_codon:yes stop_codon:yes gene_type:complete